MRQQSYLWAMLTITTASILAALPAPAQTAPFCGTNAPAPPANPLLLPIPSPRAGLVLPSRGTINALVVFIDFADDTTDIANVNWPRGEDSTDMTGHGPNFMNLFIDRTPEQQSGRKGNVTTFYRDQSLGQLTIIGHPVFRRARRTYAAYAADLTTKADIPYWATRDVLQGLTTLQVGDWAQYDSIATLGNYQQAPRPDSVIDLLIVCYRDYRTDDRQGWIGEGFPSLTGRTFAADYTIAGGRLKVRASELGCGVTCQRGLSYPNMWTPFHEIGHYLLGSFERYNDDNGGLWSVLGSPHVNVSPCMNAWEREQLGWITFREATDGLTADLPDFATTGIAYRMAATNAGVPLIGVAEYFFENHQGLPSPYIKVAEDGVFTYDIVDKLNMPSFGVPGQKGLYIVENDKLLFRVVNADGRWKWASTGTMPNPFNPTVTARIFKRGAVDRDSGRTDRRAQEYIVGGQRFFQQVWVWRDEATGGPTWLATNSRADGDAHDSWQPDEANVFTPWSNPSTGFSESPALPVGGMEVLANNSDGTVRLKFHTEHLEDAPPSRPQDLHAALCAADGTGNRHPALTWEPNTEPDVKAGGLYEVWRRDPGANAAWALIESTTGEDGTYEDPSVSVPVDLPQESVTYRYRLRAKDTQGLFSNNSEDALLVLGAPIGKRTAGRSGSAGVSAAYLTNDEIVVETRCAIPVALRLYDALGREALPRIESDAASLRHHITLPLAMMPAGRYYCIVEVEGVPTVCVRILVAQ